MDWFKGKSTGNHRYSHEIWGVPVIFFLTNPLTYNLLESNVEKKINLEDMETSARFTCNNYTMRGPPVMFVG